MAVCERAHGGVGLGGCCAWSGWRVVLHAGKGCGDHFVDANGKVRLLRLQVADLVDAARGALTPVPNLRRWRCGPPPRVSVSLHVRAAPSVASTPGALCFWRLVVAWHNGLRQRGRSATADLSSRAGVTAALRYGGERPSIPANGAAVMARGRKRPFAVFGDGGRLIPV